VPSADPEVLAARLRGVDPALPEMTWRALSSVRLRRQVTWPIDRSGFLRVADRLWKMAPLPHCAVASDAR
jgi:hypothetical protein